MKTTIQQISKKEIENHRKDTLVLFIEYKNALLAWNDSIKNKEKDIKKIKLTALRYAERRTIEHLLQDSILSEAGVKRYWDR